MRREAYIRYSRFMSYERYIRVRDNMRNTRYVRCIFVGFGCAM